MTGKRHQRSLRIYFTYMLVCLQAAHAGGFALPIVEIGVLKYTYTAVQSTLKIGVPSLAR